MYISTIHSKPSFRDSEYRLDDSETPKVFTFSLNTAAHYVAVTSRFRDCSFTLSLEEGFAATVVEQDNNLIGSASPTTAASRVGEKLGLEGEHALPAMGRCNNCLKMVDQSNIRIHERHCEKRFKRCSVSGCNALVKTEEFSGHNHCGKCGLVAKNMAKHEEIYHACHLCSCGVNVENVDFSMHLEKKCRNRKVKCRFCDLCLPKSQLDLHVESCGSKTVQCELCGVVVVNTKLDIHHSIYHGRNPSIQIDNKNFLNKIDINSFNYKNFFSDIDMFHEFPCPKCKNLVLISDDFHKHMSTC